MRRCFGGPWPSRIGHQHQPFLLKKESAFFMAVNRNKKSITLNLKRARGKEIFFKLVKGADVVIEGFRPGVMDKLGIGYRDLKRKNPKIILCSISCSILFL